MLDTWRAAHKIKAVTALEWKNALAKLPPGLTRKEVAARVGSSRRPTEKWIRILGYPAGDGNVAAWNKKRRRKKELIDWSKVNWEKVTNISDFARKHGVTRQAASLQRQKYLNMLASPL